MNRARSTAWCCWAAAGSHAARNSRTSSRARSSRMLSGSAGCAGSASAAAVLAIAAARRAPSSLSTSASRARASSASSAPTRELCACSRSTTNRAAADRPPLPPCDAASASLPCRLASSDEAASRSRRATITSLSSAVQVRADAPVAACSRPSLSRNNAVSRARSITNCCSSEGSPGPRPPPAAAAYSSEARLACSCASSSSLSLHACAATAASPSARSRARPSSRADRARTRRSVLLSRARSATSCCCCATTTASSRAARPPSPAGRVAISAAAARRASLEPSAGCDWCSALTCECRPSSSWRRGSARRESDGESAYGDEPIPRNSPLVWGQPCGDPASLSLVRSCSGGGGGGGRRGGVTGSRRAKKASWGVCPDRSAVGGARGSLMGSAAAAPSARCTHAPTPSSRGSPAGRLDLRMSTEPDRCASACCSRASRSAVQSTIHTRASNPKRTLSPCRSASRWPLIRTLLMKQPLSEPRSRSDAARPASLTSISACSPDTDRDLSTRSEPGCRPMEYDRPASRGSAWVSEVR
eukprot:scaffold3810_cov120-Isochrysis_galbana.AAC.12